MSQRHGLYPMIPTPPPKRAESAVIDLTADSPQPKPRQQQHSSSQQTHYSGSSGSSYYSNSNSQPSSQRTTYVDDSFEVPASSASLYDLDFNTSFGASIAKPKAKGSSSSLRKGNSGYSLAPATPRKMAESQRVTGGSQSQRTANSNANYDSYTNDDYQRFIRPATVGAFQSQPSSKTNNDNEDLPSWLKKKSRPASRPVDRGTGPTRMAYASRPLAESQYDPTPSTSAREPDEGQDDAEEFDLANVQYTAQDFERTSGDPEQEMQELLSGAVGDGADDNVEEGDDIVEGFASNVRLMPHQVSGVRWMAEREKGRKYGGILADDMGLGKTVQTLARIVQGQHTPAEKKLYKGGTLIVAPLAVMEQWAKECTTKTQPGLLKVTTYHGPGRAKSGKELEKFDVVITTFNVLSSDWALLPGKGKTTKKSKSRSVSASDSDDSDIVVRKKPTRKPALFEVKWLRVVIDEAQNIKNHKAKMALAAVDLQAKYRWCLTGTPIQNKVDELYSLFKFLRAKPLDNWQVFRQRVVSEVNEGRTGVAMKRLHVILKAIMLRRTKDATIDGKPILNLPARNVEVVECEFDDDEKAFYEALEKQTQLQFNKYLQSGASFNNNMTSFLTMLLRLRQACDHPALITSKDKEGLVHEKTDGVDANGDDDDDGLADLMSGLNVESKQCQVCYAKLSDRNATHCEECEALVSKAAEAKTALPSSTKIRMMIQLLKDVEARSKKREKTIVFSQFTSFLNIIEPFLKAEGINYVRYDGSLRPEQRSRVLETIRTSATTNVLLLSFKAGSTGLNLTCCNNVILLDLWWNPAIEDQAFDRAHRLGQQRDVNIFKLTIPETVEDRILELQNKKRELAQAALSGTSFKKGVKLTMDDIMHLFRSSAHD